MLNTIARGRSLRSWITLGMALAILPLAVSAVGGYLVLGRGVIASFQDVAARQRDQIDPIQRLRLLLSDEAVPLDDFVDEGDAGEIPAYRSLRDRINDTFVEVQQHVRSDHELQRLVGKAQRDWTAADQIAMQALAARRTAGDRTEANLMDRFHDLAASASDTLGAVYDSLAADLRRDHDIALQDVQRSKSLALVAAIASAIAILVAVGMISRVLSNSVQRLVSGAELFAAGDREHRIDIQVPPELHRVAEEFNRMIGRIHESEDALADLARRDSLTRLLNRRAFDEELAAAFARQQRLGEHFSLLLLDIDRFKQVNDQYGHAAGDEVLRAASAATSSDLRPFDRLFRIGGEEFAAILPGTESAQAAAAAERLRNAVASTAITTAGVTIAVTISIGVATATPASQADTLIREADAALYRAKSAGRNRVVVSDSAEGSHTG